MSKCYVCSKKRSPGISLHRIPAHEPTRSAWFKFCDFTELDVVRNVKLCSRHFEEDSFVHPASLRNGPRRVLNPTLKRLAVPTIKFPARSKNKKKTAFVSEDNKVSSSHQFEVILVKEEKLDPEETTILNLTSTLDGIRKVTQISKQSEKQTISYQPLLEDTQKSTFDSEEHLVSSSHQAEVPDPTNSETPSKQKRKFFHPRFISEITLTDVDTPKKAKQVITMVKQMDQKKSKKILLLQQQQRRLRNRITELEEVIRQFTEGENAAEW